MRNFIRNTTVVLKTFLSTVVSFTKGIGRFFFDIWHLVVLMIASLLKPLETPDPFQIDPWP